MGLQIPVECSVWCDVKSVVWCVVESEVCCEGCGMYVVECGMLWIVWALWRVV